MSTLSRFAATALISFFLAPAASQAQEVIPLTDRRVTWPNVPYQVSGANAGPRGPQAGYNRCNATTEGPNSLCQTSFLNGLDDFCLFAPQILGEPVGNIEASVVSWCTKAGHGTRIIPADAITGAQWLYAKNYVQVVGLIDQTKVNVMADDYGGELDPHGADEQGNPLGGLFFTNAFRGNSSSFRSRITSGAAGSTNYTQSIEWHTFIGGGTFCLKLCNPAASNDHRLCEHVFDRYGCTFNMAADYASLPGKYEVCDSEDMLPPGVYVTGGETRTWDQGPRTTLATPPYQVTPPASSNCQTFSAAQLWSGAAAAPAAPTTTRSSTGAILSGTPRLPTTSTGSVVRNAAATGSSTASASVRKADAGSFAVVASTFMLLSGLIGGAAILL